MVGVLCILTVVNGAMQVLDIVLFLVYTIWAALGKWFKFKDKQDLESLKRTLDSVELYVNSVEYTSLAVIPIQIAVIIMIKCCCKECTTCKKNLEEEDQFDKEMNRNMSMHRREFYV